MFAFSVHTPAQLRADCKKKILDLIPSRICRGHFLSWCNTYSANLLLILNDCVLTASLYWFYIVLTFPYPWPPGSTTQTLPLPCRNSDDDRSEVQGIMSYITYSRRRIFTKNCLENWLFNHSSASAAVTDICFKLDLNQWSEELTYHKIAKVKYDVSIYWFWNYYIWSSLTKLLITPL